jgi:hypothetical protein
MLVLYAWADLCHALWAQLGALLRLAVLSVPGGGWGGHWPAWALALGYD